MSSSRHSFTSLPAGRTSMTMSPTSFARSRGAFGSVTLPGQLSSSTDFHAEQQEISSRPEIDAVMECFRLDRNATFRRRAIPVSPSCVPLAHDVARKRHLKQQPVNDGDEQISAGQPPHALYRPIGRVDANDLTRLLDAE